jgi:RNA polymerase sigma-70 factor (ECF subfamily)
VSDDNGLVQETRSVNLEDKLLIRRFNRGDYDAVRRIYEKYKHELLALAESLLNNTAAAEDVVHDVFMSFLRLKCFRLTGSLKGYLATCVANAARNIIRANSRHGQEPLDEARAVESGAAGPDREAMAGEESRLVSRALDCPMSSVRSCCSTCGAECGLLDRLGRPGPRRQSAL